MLGGMKAEIFPGLLVFLSLLQASVSSSYGIGLFPGFAGLHEELWDTSLRSSVDEAKRLVDAAYKRTRDR
ncbi:hypothetical protein Q9966_011332 [Columba livia]|nr:hypothetical protein Q9966_011332 [Columba livia]